MTAPGEWAERFRRARSVDAAIDEANEDAARKSLSALLLGEQINPDTGFYYGDLGPQAGATNAEVRHVLLFLSEAEWRPAPVLPEMGVEAVERALAIAHYRAQIHAYYSKKRKIVIYRLRKHASR